MPAPASASVDATTVRERFNWDWTVSGPIDTIDTYDWWAVSIRIDPNEVWAEDYEGNLWVVPFSTDGEDEITFGDPERSRLVAVPVSTTDGAAATAVVDRRRQKALATNLDRPTKPERGTPAASERPNTEGISTMDESVRKILVGQGLDPDTATEEQVNAASVLSAASTLTAPPEPEAPEVPEADAPEVPADAPVLEPELAAAASAGDIRSALGLPASASDTQVRAAIVEMQDGARAGAQVQAAQLRADRDLLISDAVKDGRIAPSAQAAWRDALDRQPKAEAEALAALPKGRIPVDPAALATASATAADGQITTTGWFHFDDDQEA